jgi:protein O-GlcNAc transferase
MGHGFYCEFELFCFLVKTDTKRYIGYPNTCGLSTIDYRITDDVADPIDSRQKYVEELIKLPYGFLCYTPSLEAGNVS